MVEKMMAKIIPSAIISLVLIVATLVMSMGYVVIVTAQVPQRNEYVASCFYDATLAYNPYNPMGGRPGMGFMYPTLFIYDSYNNGLLPFIGEKFEIVDQYTLRVYIRPQARWSDGRPITSYDIYYTSWLSTQIGSGPAVGMYRHIRIITEKVFEYVTYDVEEGLKPDTPPLSLTTILGVLLLEVYPSHILLDIYNNGGVDAVKQWRNDDPGSIVVSGPYKLAAFDPYNYIVMERVDNWWGNEIFGQPKPKYFVYVGCRDNTVAIQRLQVGEIDWWTGFIPAIYELFQYGIGGWSYKPPYFRAGVPIILGFNMRNPVLADPNVRKAIAYAIPYKEIIEKGYYNYSVQASACGIVDVYPEYAKYLDYTLCQNYFGTSDCRIPFNPDKAKQILDQAGYRDVNGDGFRETPAGSPIKLIASVPQGWTDWMVIIELIAEALKSIGLNVEVRYYDAGVYFDKISRGEEIDLWMVGAEGPGPEHPLNTFRSIMVTWIASWMNYRNEMAAQLVSAIPGMTDPAAIKAAYRALQTIFYEEMPAVPLFYGAIWYAYNTRYWVGWPSADNAWWGETWAGASSGLPVMFGLTPAGTTPTRPAWARSVKEGGLLIPIEDVMIKLAGAIAGTPTPTPQMQVVTVTERVTHTVVSTTATTVTMVAPDIGITAAVGIVTLVVGLLVGYVVFKRKH